MPETAANDKLVYVYVYF